MSTRSFARQAALHERLRACTAVTRWTGHATLPPGLTVGTDAIGAGKYEMRPQGPTKHDSLEQVGHIAHSKRQRPRSVRALQRRSLSY